MYITLLIWIFLFYFASSFYILFSAMINKLFISSSQNDRTSSFVNIQIAIFPYQKNMKNAKII